MQAERANFSQLVNQITDRFFSIILTINSLILEEKSEEYRGKDSNLHTQRAPDPKSGVSTNSTTAANTFIISPLYSLYLIIAVIFYILQTLFHQKD